MKTSVKLLLAFATAAAAIAPAAAQQVVAWDEAYRQADARIAQLTLDEKISFMRGYSSFFFYGVPEKGMPYIYLSDATQGVHMRDNLSDPTMVRQLERSTAFPCPISLAATFNPSLAYRYAEAVGEECRAGGIEVLLGPGMNIYRNSQNGRNFEYMGEDPLLASAMVAEYVKGMQSTGTVACLKHFICNETEFYRRRSNSIVDERALHELYLPPFKAGIDAGVGYVMTSYNRHGAVAASANVATMVNILQGEWGFHGYNVTDFTGVSLKAAPKESLLAGTTNFCGFGASVDYWNAEALSGDRAMLLAIKNDIHNALYALANSAMLNGVKSTTVVSTVEVMTPWRVAYTACEYAFGALAALSFVFWVVSKATSKGGKKA